MLDLLISQFSVYIYGAIALIVAIFGGWFKYRGNKIDRQEVEIDNLKQENEVQDKYRESKDRVQELEVELSQATRDKPTPTYKLEPNKRYEI